MKKNNFRGFTLIELMIVVVLISILAAVTVPKLMQVTNRNRLAEATNLFQQTVANARSLAMKSRQAVVIEVRNDIIWVNLLNGTACNAPVRQRCFDFAENDGVDTDAADTTQGVVFLNNSDFKSAGVDMCDLRVAALTGGTCTIDTVNYAAAVDGIGLCYNGTGQLWIRTDADANTACPAATPAVNTAANWRKACVPWTGTAAALSATATKWFSGADVRFNRFTTGSGTCPAGGGVTPAGAEDITRRVLVPAGGHPLVKLATATE